MTTTLKYSAGWSLPGCLPEMTPVLFDTEEEARAFIAAEQEVAAEAYEEEGGADPYEYWIEPVQLGAEELAEYLAD